MAWLQRIGTTGRLTTISVTKEDSQTREKGFRNKLAIAATCYNVLYGTAILMTIATLLIDVLAEDRWALSVIIALVFARGLNILVMRRRAIPRWHGASEPGVSGDLLILLSQDRWIRMQGYVDALKTVTSGQWLRNLSTFEDLLEAAARVVVFLAAALLVPNATQQGNLVLLALLLGSAVLSSCCNHLTKHKLKMHGYVLGVTNVSRLYARRTELAEELITETKRDDWAKRLGMINDSRKSDEKYVEGVTM